MNMKKKIKLQNTKSILLSLFLAPIYLCRARIFARKTTTKKRLYFSPSCPVVVVVIIFIERQHWTERIYTHRVRARALAAAAAAAVAATATFGRSAYQHTLASDSVFFVRSDNDCFFRLFFLSSFALILCVQRSRCSFFWFCWLFSFFFALSHLISLSLLFVRIYFCSRAFSLLCFVLSFLAHNVPSSFVRSFVRMAVKCSLCWHERFAVHMRATTQPSNVCVCECVATAHVCVYVRF